MITGITDFAPPLEAAPLALSYHRRRNAQDLTSNVDWATAKTRPHNRGPWETAVPRT